MSNELTCPLCGSHDVDCLGKKGHVCLTCGYDGRSKLSTAQVVRSAAAASAETATEGERDAG